LGPGSSTTSFEDAVRAATGLGGDTDTVVAMTGGLAEAYNGLGAISASCVRLSSFDARVLYLADLPHLAHRLEG